MPHAKSSSGPVLNYFHRHRISGGPAEDSLWQQVLSLLIGNAPFAVISNHFVFPADRTLGNMGMVPVHGGVVC
jgi:hypothetical protein